MFTDCQFRENDEYAAPRPVAGVFDSPVIPICLNTEWASHLDGLLQRLLCATHWDGTETEVEATIQQVQTLIAKLADIQECPTVTDPKYIGEVFMAAVATTPANCLPCSGLTYLRTDYPALYAALDANLKTDADHFVTPQITNGRVPAGAGSFTMWSNGMSGTAVLNVGSQVGEYAHTLIVNELARHAHNVPRSSGTTSGSGAFSALSRVETDVLPTSYDGGDIPHNNMPPVTGMKFFIYAGA